MLQRLINWLTKKQITLEKEQLKISIEKSDIKRDADIRTMQKLWESYHANGKMKYDNLMNLCLFASIVGRDIQFLSKYFTISKSSNERNMFGRLLVMTIYEFLYDVNKLMGKELRNELTKNKMNEFLNSIGRLNKKFAVIKKENNKYLKTIRNNFSAHKTTDAKELIDFENKGETENIHQISTEVMKLNNEFTKLSTKMINRMAEDSKKELLAINLKLSQLD